MNHTPKGDKEMKKGYTVEVMKEREDGKGYYGSTCYNYKTIEEARNDMKRLWADKFCILTEWMQDGGFGDYEVEIERQNW